MAESPPNVKGHDCLIGDQDPCDGTSNFTQDHRRRLIRIMALIDRDHATHPREVLRGELGQAITQLSIMDQPLIAYFGQHKSGSNWIHQIMRDVCEEIGLAYGRIVRRTELDSNLSDWRTRHGAHAISWVNADWRYIGACDVRGFCVVRDPRDILVSGYFSHLKTHPTDDWPNLIPFRKKLKRVDMAEGLVLELDFMHRVWERMQHWPLVHPSVLTVRLEDFGDQYIERFESIFRFLGLFDLGLSEHSFLSIMERNSFARRSGGRSPGQEDNTSHYRKGVAGDWRNYLNEDHIALVKERLNHLLLKYEYESTPDWT